jgi:hypothetical protein
MTSTEEKKTLAGRPVIGEIQPSAHNTTPQRPIEEFVAAIDVLLATPGVRAVRWRQYTPYFNDGDECVFGVDSIYVKTGDDTDTSYVELADDDYDEDDELSDYGDGFLGDFSLNYGKNEGKYPEIYAAVKAFPDTRAFHVDLIKHFGDHATVTATPAGFKVEGYEHD